MREPNRTCVGLARLALAAGGMGLATLWLGCATGAPREGATITPERRHADGVRAAREAERLAQAGRIDEAIEKYQEALAHSGDLQGAWNNLGELYMRRGDYADAVSAFGVAAELVPSDPRPLYNTGLVYQRVGWARDAMSNYAAALERDPSMQEALRGHAVAADMLAHADERTLDYIRRGLLREKDPEWRTFFERQRFRVEAQMRSEAGRGYDADD